MTSRRQFMAGCTGSVLLGSTAAKAAGAPLSKAAVGYQDVPNNGTVCAQCVYFVFKPMQNGVLESRCRMVAGPINPAGWCEIFAPKG